MHSKPGRAHLFTNGPEFVVHFPVIYAGLNSTGKKKGAAAFAVYPGDQAQGVFPFGLMPGGSQSPGSGDEAPEVGKFPAAIAANFWKL